MSLRLKQILLLSSAVACVPGSAFAQAGSSPAVPPTGTVTSQGDASPAVVADPMAGAASTPVGGPSPAASPPAQSGVQDIVVTATRRSENLQKVPVNVTAVLASTLNALKITDTSGLQQLAPGLTIVRGGGKVNVIPSELQLELDGRLLPGQSADDLFRELRELAGDENLELEATSYEPGSDRADLSLMGLLGEVLTAADPEAVPLPMLMPGVTDGRFFARLGIQTYGFLPMRLPAEMKFTSLIHAADERVPAQEISWGTDRICEVLTRYR